MGIVYNTRSIVRDGLVLQLDAANPKSYTGTGTVWKDLSGNGKNGTLVNGTGYNSAEYGYLEFDGINDYISLGDVYDNGSAPISINLWFKFNTSIPTGPLFTNKNGTGANRIYLGTNGTILLIRIDGGASGRSYFSPSLSLSTWHNVCLTRSGARVTLFLNGEIFVLATNAPDDDTGNTDWFIMGRPSTSDYSNGNVSSLTIYNKELSETEVKKNFEALRGRYGI